jgi:hypothetical protein
MTNHKINLTVHTQSGPRTAMATLDHDWLKLDPEQADVPAWETRPCGLVNLLIVGDRFSYFYVPTDFGRMSFGELVKLWWGSRRWK